MRYAGDVKLLLTKVRFPLLLLCMPDVRQLSASLQLKLVSGLRGALHNTELGAGWSKSAKDTGTEYISVKLDDPSFIALVYTSLVQGEVDEHKLIWSR